MVLDRMLNFEIADHPIYEGLKIQGYDDEQQAKAWWSFWYER
jgi:hypothetical protein